MPKPIDFRQLRRKQVWQLQREGSWNLGAALFQDCLYAWGEGMPINHSTLFRIIRWHLNFRVAQAEAVANEKEAESRRASRALQQAEIERAKAVADSLSLKEEVVLRFIGACFKELVQALAERAVREKERREWESEGEQLRQRVRQLEQQISQIDIERKREAAGRLVF